MAQFASTLYPRTNPTNPILLDAREYEIPGVFSQAAASRLILSLWDTSPVVRGASKSQQEHACRVLTRLASFTG